MILADSSAWIEFLRKTGSPANERMRDLLGRQGLATTDPVLMELLAGAKHPGERHRAKRLLALCAFVPIDGPGDYEAAADVYTRCRSGGETVRSQIDCLIAAVAIRTGIPLLHADADFDVIARHAPLQVAATDAGPRG
jgi:predicted nucleic acid-binding protein